MGGFTAQTQMPQGNQDSGKTGQMTPEQKIDQSIRTYNAPGGPGAQQPGGKGNTITNSATSGQPRIGQPNQYSNTVGQWDNTQIKSPSTGGKGKGG